MQERPGKILTEIWNYIIGRGYWKAIPISDWRHRFMYPVDLEWHLERQSKYFPPVDDVGIPMRYYKSVGLQHNPIQICSYGLGLWNRFARLGDKQSLDRFMKIADWLVSSAKQRGEALVWEFDFDWNHMKKPWISAMAQGGAMSVLARTYHQTKDTKILDIAVQATEVLTRDVQDGGVRTYLHDKYLFFEERPNPTYILNHYLYTLVGIIDLTRVYMPDSSLETMIEDCRETLENCCEDWDLGYWSAYDLEDVDGIWNTATSKYHLLHVHLLRFLGEYFASDILTQCANQWTDYFNTFLYRLLAAKEKIHYRMLRTAQR